MAGSFDVNQLIITVEMENKCQVSLVHETLVFPWPHFLVYPGSSIIEKKQATSLGV